MQSAEHLRVGRGDAAFVCEIQLLKKLLARSQAGEHDLDVAFRKSGERDQVAGQIDDLHALSHVEHEDFSTAAHCRRLQHELRCFGDEHEEPLNFRMRDSDGPAAADLLLKRGHHAAVRTQHVAEPHDDELRVGLLRQGLHVALGNQLRAPHHARGMHGLVGGDRHERAHAVTVGQSGEQPRGEAIVLDRLGGVGFHERHVLVGRSVEDHMRPRGVEDALHTLLVENVGDEKLGGRAGGQPEEFLLDREQCIF